MSRETAPIRVVHVMANNDEAPYLNWLAEASVEEPSVELSFVALFRQRPSFFDPIEAAGLKCFWFHFNDERRKRGMLLNFVRLFRLFRRLRPDVVHTHLFDDSVPALLAARCAGVPVRIITKGDATFHFHFAPKWVAFDRFNNWNATTVCAIGSENESFIREVERPSAGKLRILRHGIPPGRMTRSERTTVDRLRRENGFEGRFVVGTVARLIEWKGHESIVAAAKELVPRYPKLLFAWAGSGPDEYVKKLEASIEHAGIEDHFLRLGWVDRDEMPSLYRAMDVYLHPAANEPFGLSIAEALMNGVPTIVAPAGASDLLEHEENAWLVKSGAAGVEGVVEGLERMMVDAEFRRSLGDAARQHALEHLTFDRMWREHVEMYREAVVGR